jgi:hypothetical protein
MKCCRWCISHRWSSTACALVLLLVSCHQNGPAQETATQGDIPQLGSGTNTPHLLLLLLLQAEAVLCEGQGDSLFRFCQQCGKLEPLNCFDSDKRSCRKSLNRRRIASAGEDESPRQTERMLRNRSSSSSSARFGGSRAGIGSRKPGRPRLMQQDSTEHPSGEATTASGRNLSDHNQAPYNSHPAVPAAAAAADAACAAADEDDVTAALAEAFCGAATDAFICSCVSNDWAAQPSAWQPTAAAAAAAFTAAPAPQQQQRFNAVLQTDALFDMCTAMEGFDGSCCSCSCSSTHGVGNEQELEQLLEYELRAAAAAPAAAEWPPAYAQQQQQVSMTSGFVPALSGWNGSQVPTAEGILQQQHTTQAMPRPQQLARQQQSIGVLTEVPAATYAFGHNPQGPPVQQLGMQQQQQQVVGIPASNARTGAGLNASELQQRLDHLQEIQQQLEQLKRMMAVVRLKRQQAAALLDGPDAAAAAAAVHAALGASYPVPMLQRSTTMSSAAVAAAAVGAVGAPTLRRAQTLESSSNGFCVGPD